MKLNKHLPKFIGVLLIILAIVGYYSQELIGAIISFIAGLILILAPKKISLSSLDKFVKSFRFDKRHLFVIAYDALFYVSVFIISFILSALTNFQMAKMGLMQLDPASLANTEILQSNIKLTQVFFISLLAYIVIFLLILCVVYTIFKGLIWLTLLKKKSSYKLFKKFFFTNLIWMAIWIIPALLAILGLKPGFFTFIIILELILYLHLTSILHYTFAKTGDLKKAYSKVLPIGFGKIHLFII